MTCLVGGTVYEVFRQPHPGDIIFPFLIISNSKIFLKHKESYLSLIKVFISVVTNIQSSKYSLNIHESRSVKRKLHALAKRVDLYQPARCTIDKMGGNLLLSFNSLNARG